MKQMDNFPDDATPASFVGVNKAEASQSVAVLS